MAVLQETNWMSASQKARRKRFRGAPTALLTDPDAIYDPGLWGKPLIMQYCGYSSVFDPISQEGIRYCLSRCGIPRNIRRFIEKQMTKWQTKLTLNGDQGDSLSPTLFLMLMDLLHKKLDEGPGYVFGNVTRRTSSGV